MFRNTLKTKKFKAALFVAVLVIGTVGAVFLVSHVSRADDAGGLTSTEQMNEATGGNTKQTDALALAFYKIINWVVHAEASIVDFLSKGLVTLAGYRGYFNEDFVRTGWGVVRDLVNLSFILVLMIIALMSILRVEESVVRKLLPRFVFAVLTVNFSFFFCRVVLDFADGISMGFQSAVTSLGSVIFKYVQAFDLTRLNPNSGANLADGAITASLVSMLLLGLLMIAIFALDVAMGVRIIALSVLIILAPFAFLAMILPQSSGLASKWAKSLFSYALWGPAALFFLWLSVITFTSSQSPLSLALSASTTESIPGVTATSGDLMKFVVVMLFLYMAIIAGKVLGNTGGDLSLKAAKGAAGLVGKIGSGSAAAVSSAFGTRGLGKEFKKKFGEWSGRNNAVRADQLAAGLREHKPGKMIGAAMPFRPKFAAKRKEKEQAKREGEYQSDFEKMSLAAQQAEFENVRGGTDMESMEKKRAYVRAWAKTADLDKALNGADKGGDYKGHLDPQRALRNLGFSGEDNNRMTKDIASISSKSDSADKRYAARAGYDAKSKSFAINNDEKYMENISDHVQSQVDKGVGDSRKLSDKLFDDDEAGFAAVAGVHGAMGFNGRPMGLHETLNTKAYNKIKNSTYHADALGKVQAELSKGGSSPVTFTDVNGKKITMARDRAEQYRKNIEEITKGPSTTSSSSGGSGSGRTRRGPARGGSRRGSGRGRP